LAGVKEARPLIIGTAGHVDHGKTALVARLTGQDTDRLPEEKRRGISIELGFAPFLLPSGRRAAIVDVPGHERFVRQMLAGATGMDVVLLVVAADEGVMPQTREHLDILSLLAVREGAIVVTKIDLVDQEWLDLVLADVRREVAGTFLAEAPIFPVSSVTGEGIPALVDFLEGLVARLEPRRSEGPVRLPIDRAFTVAGFGTVVTGTLHGGRIHVDDHLQLVPGERPVRVRGLQVHGEDRQEAQAGERVAANLAGIERQEVAHGAQLVTPGTLVGTTTLYALVEVLPSANALTNGAQLMLHAMTFNTLVTAVTLAGDEIPAGAEGFVRLRPAEPVYLRPGDLFVLRQISPSRTIGGGRVVVTSGRFRRRRAEDLEALRLLADPRPEERLKVLLAGKVVASLDEEELAAADRLGFEPQPSEGRVFLLAEARQRLERFAAELQADGHRLGWPRELLRQRFFPELDGRAYAALLAALLARGLVVEAGALVAPKGHEVRLAATEEQELARLREALLADRFHPPTQTELEATHTPALVRYLLDRGEAVRVGEFVFAREAVDEAEARLRQYLAEHAEISMGEFRELVGTSRRYAVPLLEYFDSQRVTRRLRDARVLAS
jgi:selenocysteine-specific elongation factor